MDFEKAFLMDNMEIISYFRVCGVLLSTLTCVCGNEMNTIKRSTVEDGYTFKCSKKACQKRVSIRHRSFFEKSRLSIRKLFLISFCVFKYPKMLYSYVADICSVDEDSVSQWASFIREGITKYFLENPISLGSEHAVQIDESLFGGKMKYHKGDHYVHQQEWVFGMVEEVTGLCVMWVVDDRKKDTLLHAIRNHIVPGATIKSDEFTSYKCLTKEGFTHLTVNHSVEFVSKSGTHTQNAESLWSQVKCSFKIRRGTSSRLIPGYLDLYSFQRFSVYLRKDPLELFLRRCVSI